MKRYLTLIIIFCVGISACSRMGRKEVKRPKLVIGIMIDQMRWDYLYRYYGLYGKDGFKRIISRGFNCQNTMINYIPSYTAPGHACAYTGSVPAIHGIAANDWIDSRTGKEVYCTDDTAKDGLKMMSPRNLLTTTITDELRLATNMRSRVYGIAIKDRSCILPAGHLGNGAYWFDDKTGEFHSSSFYKEENPFWLQQFNKRKMPDSFLKQNWDLLQPIEAYSQSLMDDNKYEEGFKKNSHSVFPIRTDTFKGKEAYKVFKSTPGANSISFELAKACIEGETLGKADVPDFLCISLSGTDYAGHRFTPNSVEMEDIYLRLDRDIADFLHYLDKKVGKGEYLLFISADHGGAHNVTYLEDINIPAGSSSPGMLAELNAALKQSFGKDSLVRAIINYQVNIDHQRINAAKLDADNIKSFIVDWLKDKPGIAYVIDMDRRIQLPEPLQTMLVNGYHRQRSGDIQFIMEPGWYEDDAPTGTTHGTWNPYDTHIPLLWYGWGVPDGETSRTVYMTDIAATLAAMLHVQMPNGCIGKPIIEITNPE